MYFEFVNFSDKQHGERNIPALPVCARNLHLDVLQADLIF